MGLYIKNNRYYFRKMIDGKLYHRALKLRRGSPLLAERLKQVENEILAEHFGLSKPQKAIKFNDFLEIYIAQKEFKKTLAWDVVRLKRISDFLGNPYLDEITNTELIGLEKHLLDIGFKPATVNRHFETLRHFFELAIEEGYIEKNPVKKYKFFVEDSIRRALTEEEIIAVLKAGLLLKNSKRQTDRIIFDLMILGLLTGMRISEITNLKKDQVRGDFIVLPITSTKYRRKANSVVKKQRIIYLSPLAKEIISRQKSKDNYVFDLPFRRNTVIYWPIQKIRKITGIKDFNFHLLRHTTSSLISYISDIVTAKEILGHSDIKTTLKYSHPSYQLSLRAVENLEKFLKPIIETAEKSIT
jgi:integrase